VLVLHASGRDTPDLANRLRQSLGSDKVQDARMAASPGKLRICALDGATGLEAAIVFVVGATELIESENDLQLPADQRAELIRDNTRRLYMAFTRAGARLLVTWRGDLPAWAPSN
jgi:superfamily I DNA/RNA helicase